MTSKRTQHLVVDGSNIATEGRTTPSLAQLDEAVRAVGKEGFAPITVIVDATFPRRIEADELEEFEARTLDGTIVTPPAGVVGRGDAFILQVAAQVDAVVLSNDSFQEFHGEHEWLLTEEQRLLGGKPVPNVGWVFAWRGPVRGAKSRQSIKAAKSKAATTATKRSKPKPAAPDEQVSEPKSARQKSRGRRGGNTGRKSPEPESKRAESAPKTPAPTHTEPANEPHHLNDVNEFMAFVTKYSIGDTIQGHVERYSSHGCYLRAATAQCYLPIKAMGDPPPNKARDVLSKGDLVRARVESLDARRRGINVSLVSV
ncbi:MAG: NYN domain-containing protein, partial [Acidimicrobiales bacterium]